MKDQKAVKNVLIKFGLRNIPDCKLEHHRSLRAVFKKAYILGLHYKNPIYNNYYSVKETEILIKTYTTEGMDQCLKLLPERDRASIRRKAHQLGLKLPAIWDKYSLELLANLKLSNKEVAEMLDKTIQQVNQKRVSLGLIEPHFKQWSYKYESIKEKFIELYPVYGQDTYKFFTDMTIEEARKLAKKWGIKSQRRQKAVQKQILNVETGEKFNSVKDAREIYKIGTSIFNALSNANKTAGGYHWRYIEEDEAQENPISN